MIHLIHAEVLFETGSYYVVHAGLEILIFLLWDPWSASSFPARTHTHAHTPLAISYGAGVEP